MDETAVESTTETVTYGAPTLFSPLIYSATAQFQSHEDTATHLLMLARRCEALLARLPGPPSLPAARALLGFVHALAGSAGLYGFVRLAAQAARFERAVELDQAELPAPWAELRASAGDTLDILETLVHYPVRTTGFDP